MTWDLKWRLGSWTLQVDKNYEMQAGLMSL